MVSDQLDVYMVVENITDETDVVARAPRTELEHKSLVLLQSEFVSDFKYSNDLTHSSPGKVK